VKVVIIIPVYKPELNKLEIISIKSIRTAFVNRDICFVGSFGLDFSAYLAYIPNAKVITFRTKYFKNITGYNQLLLSKFFYSKFYPEYEYILIFQLDAYIFKDNLDYWCSTGYDYIGAPVYNFYLDKFNPNKFECETLNGGFSLRKTASFIKVLNSFHFIYPFKDVFKANKKKLGFFGIFKAIYFFFRCNNTFHLFNRYDRNEDMFWAIIVPLRFHWFKKPNPKEAACFSIDNKPEICYFLNNKLPMGCHGINKHTYFWKKYIKDLDESED